MTKEDVIKWFKNSIESYERILEKRPNLKKSDLGAELEASKMAIQSLEQQDKIIQILDNYDLEAWEILEKIKEVIAE